MIKNRPYVSALKESRQGDWIVSRGRMFLVLSFNHMFNNTHRQWILLNDENKVITVDQIK